ncbi:MAG: TolC family protein [Longimicrobiales bacterium]
MLGSARRRLDARSFARLAASFVFLIGASPAWAQQTAQLSLDEAISLARKNNPDFQARQNDVAVADWAVREAYGNLLPGASASGSFGYQASGRPRFGIFTGSDLGIDRTPVYYSSDYFLGLNYALNGASLLAPGREKATRAATEAGIVAADYELKANVTRQYLAVLRARDGVTLTQAEHERTAENLKLAQARVAVGAAVPLEAKQAEVEQGRAEVNVLQARNLLQTERLRLMQILGIELNREVELTTSFGVFELPQTQDQLQATAVQAHPQLVAARSAERATEAGVRMARSAYLPSLSVSAGLSGYTRQAGSTSYLVNQARDQMVGQRDNCEFLNALTGRLTRPMPGFPVDCSIFQVSPAQEQAIISGNDVFPFNYSRQPWSAQLSVSLPIFQGFGRELQLEQAKVTAADARHRLRGEELRLKTEIASAYLNVQTARQSVALEERNRSLAAEQLVLARERYRVGVASYIELQEAETIRARADRAYLIALYSFHEGIASLETAVGQNLRPTGQD